MLDSALQGVFGLHSIPSIIVAITNNNTTINCTRCFKKVVNNMIFKTK